MTKNAFLGAVPEISTKVHGVDHAWSLIGFRFKTEHASTKDALIVEQFIALICGQTGKSVSARKALLAKSLVIGDQQTAHPFSFAFGGSSGVQWASLVSLSAADWYSTGRVPTFLATVDTLLRTSKDLSKWRSLVDSIKALVKRIEGRFSKFRALDEESSEEESEEKEGSEEEG